MDCLTSWLKSDSGFCVLVLLLKQIHNVLIETHRVDCGIHKLIDEATLMTVGRLVESAGLNRVLIGKVAAVPAAIGIV